MNPVTEFYLQLIGIFGGYKPTQTYWIDSLFCRERGNSVEDYVLSPLKILWDFSASLSESALINFGERLIT
jgi:hypothetical protein